MTNVRVVRLPNLTRMTENAEDSAFDAIARWPVGAQHKT